MKNQVQLIGHLGQDPKLKTFDSGSKQAKFSVATSQNFRDKSGEWQSSTQWHQIVAWGPLADKADQKLRKGSKVGVTGELRYHRWEDEHSQPRTLTQIIAKELLLLDPAK
ncbi:single-stranded DNA-binding protein [Pontibacter sp. G13]|uniref:single-stranded DNA-binding protein n=1 Tax=Pontibacter sp. G13 TaxID=3074898 RepID=UPI0028894CAB|nr:single-stranded DNA-binding protein [Pontibacter sp. G13]WNJ18242.1 single-stranded DNA-binding protein [Pontibacter sp. G13]